MNCPNLCARSSGIHTKKSSAACDLSLLSSYVTPFIITPRSRSRPRHTHENSTKPLMFTLLHVTFLSQHTAHNIHTAHTSGINNSLSPSLFAPPAQAHLSLQKISSLNRTTKLFQFITTITMTQPTFIKVSFDIFMHV